MADRAMSNASDRRIVRRLACDSFSGKIRAGVGTARFRPQAGEDGDEQRHDSGIGGRTFAFGQWQKRSNRSMNGTGVAKHAEMTRDDRPDKRSIRGCRACMFGRHVRRARSRRRQYLVLRVCP